MIFDVNTKGRFIYLFFIIVVFTWTGPINPTLASHRLPRVLPRSHSVCARVTAPTQPRASAN